MADSKDTHASPEDRGVDAGRLAGVPERIGAYRILKVLGEGGMGSVYLAEQTEPVQRRVALKLVKLGMDSRAVVARFELERQALALMDHDGIARVFDCGTSERGQPYFVMELVKGIPLNQYCEQNKLPLPERLQLMRQVCAAVQHAHQKAVLHRDLKPGNVLVSDEDGKAQVKVIDFGLAKAMGQKLVEATLFTEAGQIIGTPEYMAPEQADPTNQDIDTRADIYSLGVMLYELLVGMLPFAGTDLRKAGMLQMQLLRDVDPPRPSTKLSSIGDAATKVALRRRTGVGALRKALRHDLDWVVMKALDKDRNRRYQTANALGADLQRHLDHEPLEAGPPSATYRLKKLVRRHRRQVIAAGAVFAALLAGGVGTFVQFLRAEASSVQNAELAEQMTALAMAEAEAKREAEQNAERAERRASELEQVAAFQASQLSGIDTQWMGVRLRGAILDAAGEQVRADLATALAPVNFTDIALGTLEENLFERAVSAIDREFTEQPLLRAALLQTVARTLRELGLMEQAETTQRRALDIRRRVLGADHPDTLTSVDNQGLLLQALGRFDEAEPLYREALESRRRVLGADHPDTLTSIHNMGYWFEARGELGRAEPLYREALDGSRRVLGDEHPDTLSSMNSLGSLLHLQVSFEEAELLLRGALEARRRVLGDEHPETLSSINNLALLLRSRGDVAESERYHREALESSRRVLGDEHPHTLSSINNLGLLLKTQGRLAEAETYYREALESSRRVLGDEHPNTLTSINNLGVLLKAGGRIAEAEPYYREALDGRRRVLGDEHPSTLTSVNNLGVLLKAQGRIAEAEPLYRETVETARRILGDEHPRTLISIHNLGILLLKTGRHREALEVLLPAEGATRRVFSDRSALRLALFLRLLGEARVAAGGAPDYASAEENLLEAHTILARLRGPTHAETLRCIEDLAGLYTTWHAAQPDQGHDRQATQWRATAASSKGKADDRRP